LRCSVTPSRPALNYDFRFETGYVVDIPLDQLRGSDHHLTTSIRVTPEGLPAVYFNDDASLPAIPSTKADGEFSGTFVTGEGVYRVELLIEDDLHRACYSSWEIQARRTGNERQLKTTTRPGEVEEIFAPEPPEAAGTGPRIGRLTILLHAAPLSPNLSKLQPEDIGRLADTVRSVMREMPAQSVRLIAFNLAQQAIVFQKDGFQADQMDALTGAIGQLQLALVDYRTLQKPTTAEDFLTGLLQDQLSAAQPPDAVIVMGPRTAERTKPPQTPPANRAAEHPLFYLEYQWLRRPMARGLMQGPMGRGPMQGPMGRGPMLGQSPLPRMADGTEFSVGSSSPQDEIEHLLQSFHGEMLVVRTPHELADAIAHMEVRIPRTAAPSAPAANPTTAPEATEKLQPAPDKATAEAQPKRDEPEQSFDLAGSIDPVQLLMRVRDQVVEHGVHIPNHTCVETVQRDRYESETGRTARSCETLMARRKQPGYLARLKLSTTDWLRLDVALATGREIYSWAGARKFEEGDIDELIPEGAMGTGPFAALLLGIFEPSDPRFAFEGETALNGRKLYEYSFFVPRDESHYRVKSQNRREWLVTGYSGRLFIDPKTAELVQLRVQTEELPEETGSCETQTTLEYGMVQLGEADYFLPKAARQRFLGRNGEEAENNMSFAACREYQAESTVSFGEGPSAGGSRGGQTAGEPQFTPGLSVSVEVASAVHPGSAAAGDRIEGHLVKPLRDPKRNIVITQGAPVHGRLMRVELRHGMRPELTVALRWETVQLGDSAVPFPLTPDRRPADLQTSTVSGMWRRTEIELPRPNESAYGVYHFFGENASMPKGFRTDWLTGPVK